MVDISHVLRLAIDLDLLKSPPDTVSVLQNFEGV